MRCARCLMHQTLCVCALIPTLQTRTRLVLVMHRDEVRKPSNTGRLAAQCLPNSELLIRGDREGAALRLDLAADRQPILLYPHEDALPIVRFADAARPITLIVPDGTWRQAAKVRNRLPGLREIPCVSLPADEPTRYRLRAETHEAGLATLEAIARAFGVLEGAHVREGLERVFQIMVERTLWLRGTLRSEQVTGGIPEAALREDPRG